MDNTAIATVRYNKQKILEKILLSVLVIFLLVLSMWIKIFISSSNDYKKALHSYEKQQTIKAINYLDRSMHWYVPLNPYIRKSADMLFEISDQAESDGNKKISFIALNTIKNSIYSLRPFYSPGDEIIAKSEHRLERLIPMLNPDFNNSLHLETEYNDPDNAWSAILLLSLFGWIGSVFGFLYFRLNNRKAQRVIMGSAWFWLSGWCLCYVLWITAMIKA